MTILVPKAPWPVLIIGTAVLLLSLFLTVRSFSRKRQRDAVKELQEYFYLNVCPRSELASYLQELPLNYVPPRAGKLPKTGAFCQQEWVEREAEELNSLYYLRTGQRVSILSAMGPAGSWYGLEAWIRDILASKGGPLQLAGAALKVEPMDEET